ncbi:MAG: hypothetical protein OXF28_02155 [Thaumarchaeota archaeon]|nr:hypothetical protein [Nitrososphaerota archaeon]
MYDKNYVDSDIKKISNLAHSNIINIYYKNPFTKINFIDKLIKVMNYEIIYVDCDLLYSGYVKSGILRQEKSVTIIQPTNKATIDNIKNISLKLAKQKCLLIIDSLNSFNNVFSNDSGIKITTTIMLLTSLAKISKSMILLSSNVDSEDEYSFTLSIIGTYIIKPKKLHNVYIK